jgi:predicted RNA binding protein YcfA (HicA-like mRNA interferase family)
MAISCAVPFHGSKDMGKGIVIAIIKEMGLK